MIRQTRIYLAGAVSATVLIGAAVVAFAILVSLQVLRDWPVSALGGGDAAESRSVTPDRPFPGEDARAAATTTAAAEGLPTTRGGTGDELGGTPGSARSGVPAVGAPVGGRPGSRNESPPSSRDAGGSTSRNGGPGAGGGPDAGGSSGGESGAGEANGPDGGFSPTETVTGTIGDTVSGIDRATGGALGDAGVTDAAEDAVDGAVGPDSKIGGAVDGTAGAVEGLLDESR